MMDDHWVCRPVKDHCQPVKQFYRHGDKTQRIVLDTSALPVDGIYLDSFTERARKHSFPLFSVALGVYLLLNDLSNLQTSCIPQNKPHPPDTLSYSTKPNEYEDSYMIGRGVVGAISHLLT